MSPAWGTHPPPPVLTAFLGSPSPTASSPWQSCRQPAPCFTLHSPCSQLGAMGCWIWIWTPSFLCHQIQFLTQAGSAAWRDGEVKDKSSVHCPVIPASRSTSVTHTVPLLSLFPVRRLSLGQGPSSAPALIRFGCQPGECLILWSHQPSCLPAAPSNC